MNILVIGNKPLQSIPDIGLDKFNVIVCINRITNRELINRIDWWYCSAWREFYEMMTPSIHLAGVINTTCQKILYNTQFKPDMEKFSSYGFRKDLNLECTGYPAAYFTRIKNRDIHPMTSDVTIINWLIDKYGHISLIGTDVENRREHMLETLPTGHLHPDVYDNEERMLKKFIFEKKLTYYNDCGKIIDFQQDLFY